MNHAKGKLSSTEKQLEEMAKKNHLGVLQNLIINPIEIGERIPQRFNTNDPKDTADERWGIEVSIPVVDLDANTDSQEILIRKYIYRAADNIKKYNLENPENPYGVIFPKDEASLYINEIAFNKHQVTIDKYGEMVEVSPAPRTR